MPTAIKFACMLSIQILTGFQTTSRLMAVCCCGCPSTLYNLLLNWCLASGNAKFSHSLIVLFCFHSKWNTSDFLATLIMAKMINFGSVGNLTTGYVDFTSTSKTEDLLECLSNCIIVHSDFCLMAFYQNGTCYLGSNSAQPVYGTQTLANLFVARGDFSAFDI